MKLSKRDLKHQQEVYKLLDKDKLTWEETELFYDEFNPGLINNLSQGVYFTPNGLASDVALFCPRRGHILDLCAGVGCLSWNLLCRDSYDKNIKSITCIELDQQFVDIGKKLLPEANWICANVFTPGFIDDLLKQKGIEKFDLIVSNPPFGKIKQTIEPQLNYKGSLDLMVLELALRYAKNGYFILPSNSAPFKYSGSQYYKENIGRELNRFLKANKEFDFALTCDAIDCDIYRDQWKNLNGISVEAVNVDISPYSLYDLQDSITKDYK